MGNSQSSSNTNTNTNTNNEDKSKLKDTSFGQIIDYIATKYILTADFQNLKKLYEKDYCDNLIILTSDIIEKYFTDLEISYLSQRIKNGVEENIMEKDKLIFLTKSDIDKLNVNVPLKKKRVCIGIAKFYVKIAHVFAAIVMTINPVYVYKDVNGNIIKRSLSEKNMIPPNVERKIYKSGICGNRIHALKRGQDYNAIPMETGEITLNPNICSVNVNENFQTKTLEEEPGIPELMELYNDKYDYQTAQFIGMTPETEKEFKKDLELFYKTFTGNDNMPDNINKFSDIKLRDYQTSPGCQKGLDGNIPYNNKIKGSVKVSGSNTKDVNETNKLFLAYAENLKNMMINTNKNQDDLLNIINSLFSYVIDKQTGARVIRVNPKLTEEGLQSIIKNARNNIIQLYLKCENDYVKGVKIYQAIVEKKIRDTAIKQIEVLEKTSEELINNK
jgi:hypothetical protein